MATVVITFFLLTRFYVCKMDAEFIDTRRCGQISRREQRWSMNSQRLDEIVAELMKPISDVRRSFDTDLSALMEEYLTEAGLHALEAGEAEDGGVGGSGEEAGAPNFAELALLLQHSASVYGRKVDFLYQHVLTVSDSLHNSTLELERQPEGEAAAEASGGGGTRRRRRSTAAEAGFGWVTLAAGAGAAAREAGAARPPPTLPRAYIELEPRQLCAADRPLTDYDNEPVGLLADFHVSWRLQDGMLVDELEACGGGEARRLRPIPLMELHAAIVAHAPPPPPPPPPPPRPTPPRDACPSPLHASTPLPPPPPAAEHRQRKRRNEVNIDDILAGSFKMLFTKETARRLQRWQEFSVPAGWRRGVLRPRATHIRRLRATTAHTHADFRGFDDSESDVGGFLGWSISVAAEAQKQVEALGATVEACGGATGEGGGEADSDDDGFFEQSSLGDSDASRNDESTLPFTNSLQALDNTSAWSAWRAGVVARAAAGEARGLDVRALAARLLAALPPPSPAAAPAPAPTPAPRLLRAAAAGAHDVPGLFLATLFLANAGKVEIVPGAPLTLNSFSVRALPPHPRR